MHYPYERFLRFLVSRKVDLNQTLEKCRLPLVTQLWCDRAEKSLLQGAPHSVESYLLASGQDRVVAKDGFLEWANLQGFGVLWETQEEFGGNRNPAVDQAYWMFSQTPIRALLGMLLLSRATEDEICDALEEKFSFSLEEDTIHVYQSVFWDVSLLDPDDWERFIPLLETKEERHFIGVGLSSPSAGMARTAANLKVDVDPEDALTEILQTSMKYYRIAARSSEPIGHDIQRWADMAMNAIKLIKHGRKLGAAEHETEMPSSYRNLFSVEVTQTEHPSLSEIKGHISKDAQPSGGG